MIKEFKENYRWLSNFAPVEIIIDGITYPSVEHAYMSHKSNEDMWKMYCSKEPKAYKVKQLSKTVKLIPDWDEKKIPIMKKCLEQKFKQEPYKTKLIETGLQEIQEGNTWGDEFWGINIETGDGKNILGQLIMEIRGGMININEILNNNQS